MKMKNWAIALTFAGSSMAFATSPSPYTHLTANIQANNHVGVQLLQAVTAEKLATENKVENTMISPISAYMAFSMLHAGIGGQSQQQLQQFMNLPPRSLAHFDAQNRELMSLLQSEPSASRPQPKGSPQAPIVGIYNSAWATNGATTGHPFVFDGKFLDKVALYQTEVQKVDFADPNGAGAAALNQWADQKTRGLIPQIIDEDTAKQLVWALMNATYMEANWATQFHAIPAQHAVPFNQIDGTTAKRDRIIGSGAFRIASTEEYDAIEVPFYASDLAFYVRQPKTVALFQQMLSSGQLHDSNNWISLKQNLAYPKAEDGQVVIRLDLPKFSFPTSVAMGPNSPIARRLGLGFLFDDRNDRDFQPMGLLHLGGDKYANTVVGLIKQDSKIELDENGVKAAAVTLIGGVRSTSIRQPPIEIPFVVDKPFQFAIASKKTGAILFMGHVVSLQ